MNESDRQMLRAWRRDLTMVLLAAICGWAAGPAGVLLAIGSITLGYGWSGWRQS